MEGVGADDAGDALDAMGRGGGATLAGPPLGGGTLGRSRGPNPFGTSGGGGTDGMSGACGLRGAIPDAFRLAGGSPPARGICGASGATGADGVWGRTGSFGWAIYGLSR